MPNIFASIVFMSEVILMITAIEIKCYADASVTNSSSSNIYLNFTWESCRCQFFQLNTFAVQYDEQQQSCYVFTNAAILFYFQSRNFSRFCFLNGTETWLTETTTTSTAVATVTTTIASTITTTPITTPTTSTSASGPFTVSTSYTGNTNYRDYTVTLTNTIPLSSLRITVTVPKTHSLTNPNSHTTFWNGYVSTTTQSNSSYLVFIFTLVSSNPIVVGQWNAVSQFSMPNTVRPSSNDTYLVEVSSYPSISGHF